MSKDIFKRVEVKYLLSSEQYDELMGKLEPYMVQDEYGLSSISSFYYDTPRYNIVRESLEKPVYKEKFRLRSYGEMKEGSKVFLELKKKYKGVVYKRRVSLSFEEAKAYLEDGVYPDTDSQILREIDYFLKFYDTSVKNYVEYNRIALYGKENKEIRITFDSDICAALDCDSLKRPSHVERIMGDGERLMEIKVPDAMPIWLVNMLSELKIYPTSFSKYGKACKMLLEE